MNQIKPKMMLSGRVSRDHHAHRSLENSEKLANVKKYVEQFFWCCKPYFHNEDRLLDTIHPYPEFFSAGWFVDGDKQKIVVVHGNSMEDANKRLIQTANKVDWNVS